ncbi:cytochrome P450 [Pluteus cervinus]|uniref:Cytochrome P450 n=1 Tax=Pluteus cervinus TaxID=181527 RepID=A0ACD3B5G9_9AGAR|nr:cytochrome P450 [Pluteus cervinus]
MFYFALIAILASLFLARSFGRRRRFPLPPGPRGLPLLGNALQIPRFRPWETYKKWEKLSHGPLVYAKALGQHILVANNFDDALELLEKRSAIHSDRPFMLMFKLMGWDAITAFMKSGNTWRQHHKVLQHIRRGRVERFHPLLAVKTGDFLHKISTTPKHFDKHANYFSASIMMVIAYGYDLQSPDDPILKMVCEAVESVVRGFLPGGFVVDTFPFLRHLPRWFPGVKFHDYAAGIKKMTYEAKTKMLDLVEEEIRSGIDRASICHAFLKEGEAEIRVEKSSLRDAAFTVFSGGMDTTSAGLKIVLLALATHPDVQKKAQAEISSVTRNTRLPDFDDRASLPYLGAIIREALRWKPPAPLGVPHQSTQEDVYKGYLIPQGTIIMSNIWAMTRNEEIYPDPESFKPERFLNPDGTLNSDDRYLTFGFGRRVCPGQYLALDSIWLATAQTLASLTLSNPVSIETGNELTAHKTDFVEGLGVWIPRPFGFDITPNKGAEHLLNFAD